MSSVIAFSVNNFEVQHDLAVKKFELMLNLWDGFNNYDTPCICCPIHCGFVNLKLKCEYLYSNQCSVLCLDSLMKRLPGYTLIDLESN